MVVRFKRIKAGLYETLDGKYQVMVLDTGPGYRRKTWSIRDFEDGKWDFLCDFATLADARDYLETGNSNLILS